METITKSIIGVFAVSTLCSVLVHDTNIDKVTLHVMRSHQSSGLSGSTQPHTHSERNPLGGKRQASTARDPRDDKSARHHNQSDRDYFRLPGQSESSDHVIHLA